MSFVGGNIIGTNELSSHKKCIFFPGLFDSFPFQENFYFTTVLNLDIDLYFKMFNIWKICCSIFYIKKFILKTIFF